MSIYDRDFSQIKAAAVVEGSKAQAQNVLQAALDEISRLRAELAQARKDANGAHDRALEKAAKFCDGIAGNWVDHDRYERKAAGKLSAAIRPMKEKKHD